VKLDEYIEVCGIIHCETGLHIGGTKDAQGIGETDNPIIRHPITRLPYIPGSSLKGKTRCLLEVKKGRGERGRPCDCGTCTICNLYGSFHNKIPTRLIFRDAPLTPEWEEKLQEALPGFFAETKTEIAMDREKGSTMGGSLREQERVPAGTEFDFNLVIRFFEGDDRKEFYTYLAEAFEMLEKDYLGGSGTRGYGKVKITHENTDKPLHEFFSEQTKAVPAKAKKA
jgi:CRISPR-associated protein Csm3